MKTDIRDTADGDGSKPNAFGWQSNYLPGGFFSRSVSRCRIGGPACYVVWGGGVNYSPLPD